MVILFNCYQTQAQLNSSISQDFSQSLINPYILNPAALDTSYSYAIKFNHLSELGIFRVNRFYFDVDKHIETKRKNEHHFIGVNMYNAKMGDYISRNRLHGRYSWLSQVGPQTKLSFGMELGFVNFAFQTTDAGTGGSDFGPDGAIGLHIMFPNSYLGVSLQQLFSPILIPINQSFVLHKIYGLDLGKCFFLRNGIEIETQGVFQVNEMGQTHYGINASSILLRSAFLGISHHNLQKSSVYAGFKNRPLGLLKLTLMCSYSLYTQRIKNTDSTIEVFASFQK